MSAVFLRRSAALIGAALLWAGPPSLGAEKMSRRERDRRAAEASALFEKGDYPGARQKWEEALAGGASQAEARRWRPWIGRAFEAEGNFQKALAAYQDAYDNDFKSVDRMVDLARLYDVVELDDQAVRFYEEAYSRDRSRRDVALALARIHLEAGRLAQAQALASSAVAAASGDLAAQELLARIEEAQGQLQSAARRRETMMAQRPTADGYLALARLWARQDAYDQADLAFARAEKAGAPPAEAVFERAALAWRKGERPKAILFLEEAERRDPAFFPALFVAAILDEEAGRFMSARVRMMEGPPPDEECARWKIILDSVLERRAEEGKR